jgi:hypothetical protein
MELEQKISTVAASTAGGIRAMEFNKPYPIVGASRSFRSKVVLLYTKATDCKGILFLD